MPSCHIRIPGNEHAIEAAQDAPTAPQVQASSMKTEHWPFKKVIALAHCKLTAKQAIEHHL
jgi:hypothetical protein